MTKTLEVTVHAHGAWVRVLLAMSAGGVHVEHSCNSCALPLTVYKDPAQGVPDNFTADNSAIEQLTNFEGRAKLVLVRVPLDEYKTWRVQTFEFLRENCGILDLKSALRYAPYNEMAVPVFLAYLSNRDVDKLNELLKNLTLARR